RVGDELGRQVVRQRRGADRIAHERVLILALLPRDLLAEKLGVIIQGRGRLVVGLLEPPGELGLVAVVEAEPFAEGAADLPHRRGRATGNDGRELDGLAFGLGIGFGFRFGLGLRLRLGVWLGFGCRLRFSFAFFLPLTFFLALAFLLSFLPPFLDP